MRRLPTERELQVLRLVAAGQTREQIGVALGISPLTVKAHLGRVSKLVGASDRTHAVAIVIRAGLLEAPSPPGSVAPLGDRQVEVLQHASNGRTGRQTASAMYVSEDTVKTHMRRVFAKLGCSRDRAAAVAVALGLGIIT